MNRKLTFLGIAILGVVCILVPLLWPHVRLGDVSTTKKKIERDSIGDSPRSPHSTDDSQLVGADHRERTQFVLPGPGIRLSSVVKDLEQRAAQGNSDAACYLAIQFAKCRRLPDSRDAIDEAIQQAASQSSSTSDAQVADIVSRQAALNANEDMCLGISKDQANQAWKYMVQAADAGNTPLAVEFAIRPPLDPDHPLDDIDGWKTYKAKLWAYLQNGIEGGDYSSLQLAFGLVSGQDSVLGMSDSPVKVDPQKAAVYASVLARIGDPFTVRTANRYIAGLRNSMNPADLARATDDASKLYQTRYLRTGPNEIKLLPDEVTNPSTCSSK